MGQGGLAAQNGTGQSGTLVDGGGQPLRHQILRGVLIHINLFQNDAPLQIHILLGKAGVEEHIGENVQPPVQMAAQGAGIEAGVLLGGVGVDLAADGVHVPGQLSGGAPGGAFEKHVLDKVGRAVFGRRLMAGAYPHKKAQSGGLGLRQVLGEKPGPIGQVDLLVHKDLLDHCIRLGAV